MKFNLFLAGLVLVVHLTFILWVIFGWLFTCHSPLRRWLHIGCVIYAIFIEVSNRSCPLTLLENLLEQRAGVSPYHQPFILHYLELLVYPNIPLDALITTAVIVCLGILSLYFWRYRHRGPRGW
jgi:hypothetical protein